MDVNLNGTLFSRTFDQVEVYSSTSTLTNTKVLQDVYTKVCLVLLTHKPPCNVGEFSNRRSN